MKYMKKKVDLLVMGFKRSQVQYLAILELTDLLRILCINTVPQQLYYLQSKKAQALAHLVDQLDYNDHSVEHSYFQILKSIHK